MNFINNGLIFPNNAEEYCILCAGNGEERESKREQQKRGWLLIGKRQKRMKKAMQHLECPCRRIQAHSVCIFLRVLAYLWSGCTQNSAFFDFAEESEMMKNKQKTTSRAEKKVQNKIDNNPIFSSHEDRMLDDIAKKVKSALPEKSRSIIDRCLELYHKHEFVILIAGEISVGKSSFLNALMGYPVLLMDQTETTAAITYLRSAEGHQPDHPDEVKINYIDGRHEWFSIHDHERMKAATTSLDGNKQAIRTVRSAEVYLSEEILPIPPGITIIDTPGLNGSVTHSDLTHAEMGLCHVALFLLDATKFGTLSNQEEFQRLYRYAPELLFVVNMWDRVRNASSRSLEEVKKEDYMPKLCNWAKQGEVTDANIFVISNKEAMNVMARFVNMTDEEKSKTSPSKMLEKEHPDNEFFFLFGALNRIMNDRRKQQLIQIRPVQTMLSVVQDHLFEISQKKDQFNLSEFDQKIKLEQLRIQKQQDELEEAYEVLRQSAARLADYETAMYKNLLEENSRIIANRLDRKIDETEADQIMDESTVASMRTWLNGQIKRYYEVPLNERFQAFISYLKGMLESQVQIKAGENISLESASALQDNFSTMTRQREALNQEIKSLSSKQSSIQYKINQANEGIARCKEEISRLEKLKASSARLKKRCEEISEQISDLGPRPAVRYWSEREEYEVERPRAWYSLYRLFGSTTYTETRYRTVQHSDDSARREWDAEKERLDEKLAEARQKYNASKVDESQINKLKRNTTAYESNIQVYEEELDEIKSKEKAQRAALKKNFSAQAVKTHAANYWRSETASVLSRYTDLLSAFKGNVDKLLESFWKQRKKNVEKYILTLSIHEKALLEEQRAQNEEYYKCNSL